MRGPVVLIITAMILAGCTASVPPQGYEAISFLGKPLPGPTPDAAKREQLLQDFALAKARYEANPESEEAIIWLGRRTAYLGRFSEAIEIYTRGLRIHPDSAAILRHRGHRYITTRQLDKAITDLSRAWELVRGTPDITEPDGVPNEKNTPIGSLHSNISYHLGLAYYLKGDFDRALTVYRDRMEVSRINDDRFVSTTYWTYLTLRHLGRDAEAAAVLAAIGPQMQIIENQSYHRLLLLFKGDLSASELLDISGEGPIENGTVAYGIACQRWFSGNRADGEAIWRRITASSNWPAFGFIAAEAELARLER